MLKDVVESLPRASEIEPYLASLLSLLLSGLKGRTWKGD